MNSAGLAPGVGMLAASGSAPAMDVVPMVDRSGIVMTGPADASCEGIPWPWLEFMPPGKRPVRSA